MTDGKIIKEYEGLTPRQQLTLFRNLYYNDGYATERGIVANAINDILPEYDRQQADAIKEFAWRLKNRRGTHGELWGNDIDNLVKEMTEEQP